MAQEWNIKPRARVCSVCGAGFPEGTECVSALFASDGGGYERRDYCPGCWSARQDGGEPFSQWQSTIAPAPQAGSKSEPIKRETAEALLRRLVELDDPANVNVIYILAVMLERKKQLIERDAKPRPEGGIVRIYEHKASGDTFIIVDPQLRLDAIGEVQKQVMELLG
jgi:hypothetical protein